MGWRVLVLTICMSKQNGKKRKPAVDLHVRLYDDFDRMLIAWMDHDRKANERSWQKQVKHMLRRAAGAN